MDKERRHPPGPDPAWEESWYLDFAAPDAGLGGFVRLALRPHRRQAWYWAYLVGDRRPVVVVRHHDVALPRAGLDVRAEGLWAALHCETPMEHWSTGLEAFAVALDDPADALAGERGELVPFGLDLEWEAAGPERDRPDGGAYGQPGDVHGEILVGADRIAFEGAGWRAHAWGAPGWAEPGWTWAAGRLDDGTPFQASTVATELDPAGLPAGGSLRDAGLELAVEVRRLAFVPLDDDGRGAPAGSGGRLVRGLCRFRSTDGRAGTGWAEWSQPRWGPVGQR